eukprot:Rhum_TRINITY_DN10242_c0_g2::Rhum_TRINITY_DN10242_c0_g2_i1::g.37280::m.37280
MLICCERSLSALMLEFFAGPAGADAHDPCEVRWPAAPPPPPPPPPPPAADAAPLAVRFSSAATFFSLSSFSANELHVSCTICIGKHAASSDSGGSPAAPRSPHVCPPWQNPHSGGCVASLYFFNNASISARSTSSRSNASLPSPTPPLPLPPASGAAKDSAKKPPPSAEALLRPKESCRERAPVLTPLSRRACGASRVLAGPSPAEHTSSSSSTSRHVAPSSSPSVASAPSGCVTFSTKKSLPNTRFPNSRFVATGRPFTDTSAMPRFMPARSHGEPFFTPVTTSPFSMSSRRMSPGFSVFSCRTTSKVCSLFSNACPSCSP